MIFSISLVCISTCEQMELWWLVAPRLGGPQPDFCLQPSVILWIESDLCRLVNLSCGILNRLSDNVIFQAIFFPPK